MKSPDVATSSLTVGEGMTGMYSVRLESQPTGTVTVMVRGASGDVTVKPSRLVFTTGNWDEEQMVEVKAGQDDDAEPDPGRDTDPCSQRRRIFRCDLGHGDGDGDRRRHRQEGRENKSAGL